MSLQTRGSLAESNVRSLLEAAQAERATGTLTLRHNGAGATTLYFLFGHLFHALGDGSAGDDAVVSALAWGDGDFDFDAKAKLPADETVRSSIPELIERSSTSGAARPAASPRPEAAQRPAGASRRSQPAAAAPTPPAAPQEAAWAPPDTAGTAAPAPTFNSGAHQGTVAPGVPAAAPPATSDA